MDTSELGRQVRALRLKLGLSQDSLAEKASISRNYVSIIERGEAQNVSLGVLQKLAAALGSTPSQLTGADDQSDSHIPAALRELARRDNLSFSVVDKLARVPRRGQEPQTADEWKKLYNLIQKYL